jgi:anti-sigma B factor antagonist
MKTEVRHEKDITIVAANGDVDALTAPDLARAIVDQIAEGHVYLVIDLTGVEFMSSSGLLILFDAVKETRSHGGDLRVITTDSEIDNVLKISGFHSVARVFTSEADALAGFGI